MITSAREFPRLEDPDVVVARPQCEITTLEMTARTVRAISDITPGDGGEGMPERLKKLLEPIRVGAVDIKNRVAMAPMGLVGLLDPEGCPGQRATEYYLERARGGVGLIITGLFKVETEIDYFEETPFYRSHYAVARFAELAEAVHAWGAKILYN